EDLQPPGKEGMTMEEIKVREMTAGDEIIEADWRGRPHRFDTSSRVERFALLMLLADVAEYARYLHDFAVSFYGDEVAEGVADFYDFVTGELHGRAAAEGVTPDPVRRLEILKMLYWRDS